MVIKLQKSTLRPVRSRNFTLGTRSCIRDAVLMRTYWMRERAQRADSAITESGEEASFSSKAVIRVRVVVPRGGLELPNALQALRIRPRHLVRLIGLSRKALRNSVSPILASDSSRGRKRDSSSRKSSSSG